MTGFALPFSEPDRVIEHGCVAMSRLGMAVVEFLPPAAAEAVASMLVQALGSWIGPGKRVLSAIGSGARARLW